MKKKILALSILAVLSANAMAAQVNDDDLRSIDQILNDNTNGKSASSSKETQKKPTKQTAKEKREAEQAKAQAAEESEIQNKAKEAAKRAEQKAKDTETQQKTLVTEGTNIPKIIVPVIHKELAMEIDYQRQNIFTKTLNSPNFTLTYSDQPEDKFKSEPVIKDLVDKYNQNKTFVLKDEQVEPDVLVDVETGVKEGKTFRKNVLKDISYGSNFIVQIKEVDDKNQRIRMRLDYSYSFINSYSEREMRLEDGQLSTVRVPEIKKTELSKEFYMPMKSGAKIAMPVSASDTIVLTMNRFQTLVETVPVDNHEAIAAAKVAKEEAEKKAAEEAKQKKVDEEKKLFDDLEKKLK